MGFRGVGSVNTNTVMSDYILLRSAGLFGA